MNKLEQEIEERIREGLYTNGNMPESLFKQGAQFIIDKNLAVHFAKWLDENYPTIEKFIDNDFLDWNKAYDYWINNVYGH
jgi:hypothetical protein